MLNISCKETQKNSIKIIIKTNCENIKVWGATAFDYILIDETDEGIEMDFDYPSPYLHWDNEKLFFEGSKYDFCELFKIIKKSFIDVNIIGTIKTENSEEEQTYFIESKAGSETVYVDFEYMGHGIHELFWYVYVNYNGNEEHPVTVTSPTSAIELLSNIYDELEEDDRDNPDAFSDIISDNMQWLDGVISDSNQIWYFFDGLIKKLNSDDDGKRLLGDKNNIKAKEMVKNLKLMLKNRK